MFSLSIMGMFVYKEVASNDTIITLCSMGTGNISDIVGNCGRILGVVIFIFNINFKNISYVFFKIVQWGATI